MFAGRTFWGGGDGACSLGLWVVELASDLGSDVRGSSGLAWAPGATVQRFPEACLY